MAKKMKPWEKDKETKAWFIAAAEAVEAEALAHPEIPIPVDPEVAEFMGAMEDPAFTDDDLYPSEEYLKWLKEINSAKMD
jgi:hypothetical protein